MTDGAVPQNAYERKLKLILDAALARFKGQHTPAQYAIELKVAQGMLAALGVKP